MAMATGTGACAVYELVAKGRESAAVLKALFEQQPEAAGEMPHGLRDLAEQILRCFNRALAALRSGTSDAAGGARKRKPERGSAAALATSSKRTRASGGENGTRVEKKWTMEDGFIWRKYGHKDIQDSKYPRLYFRCTYKDDHGCMARRQVQRSEADPSVYLITYFGEHTCCRGDDEPPAPFVINFGSSTRDEQPSGSPWPSCEDDGLVVSKTSEVFGLPEEEELRAGMGNVTELIEKSTPVPEPTGPSSPGSEPFDGCLDWVLGESSFDIGESINYDDLAGLLQ
ncbi:transcription factor WRKY45-2-like [Phragmites australis]|uniref:transcription factor WRKY45-2-like n=1 Tax=Phragmites australis TaxID=29695 RepID=UPI002D781FDA|nr:transcription factor WRKY45-2-like [Phragmites australis]